ncbi:hypothetical protein D3C78_1347550 [compost metagenome]
MKKYEQKSQTGVLQRLAGLGRRLPGAWPETQHRRHQPDRSQPRAFHPHGHRPVFGADVPARTVRQAMGCAHPPPLGPQADLAGHEQLPDPAQDPALGDHGPDRGCPGLAVLRFARRSRYRHPDPDLRTARAWPEHRGRSGRSARPGLCRLLRRRRLHLCPAIALLRPELLDLPADCRPDGGDLRLPARLPGIASAR